MPAVWHSWRHHDHNQRCILLRRNSSVRGSINLQFSAHINPSGFCGRQHATGNFSAGQRRQRRTPRSGLHDHAGQRTVCFGHSRRLRRSPTPVFHCSASMDSAGRSIARHRSLPKFASRQFRRQRRRTCASAPPTPSRAPSTATSESRSGAPAVHRRARSIRPASASAATSAPAPARSSPSMSNKPQAAAPMVTFRQLRQHQLQCVEPVQRIRGPPAASSTCCAAI